MNEVDTCRTYAVPKVQAAGWEGETGAEFVANLRAHHGKPSEITSVSIDTAPLIKGVQEPLRVASFLRTDFSSG